jgi:hypothetical protein
MMTANRNTVPCKICTKRTKRHSRIYHKVAMQVNNAMITRYSVFYLHTDDGDHGLPPGTGTSLYSGYRFLY